MTASAFAASIARIGQVQTPLSTVVTVLVAILMTGAAMIPGVWPVARHLTVMAHEGAHATLGSAVGRTISSVELRASGVGKTLLSGGGKLGSSVVAFGGYLGPSAFGVGAAGLISAGYIVAVLWLGLAGLLGMLVSLRRISFGIVTLIVAFVLLFGVAAFMTVTAQIVTSYALTWFLLVSGVRIIVSHGANAEDAGTLRSLTRVPAGFWSRLWLVTSVGALLFGASLLF